MSSYGKRQHCTPHIIKDGKSTRLTRVRLGNKGQGTFNEDWLQDQLFENPNLLPVNEIEPEFGPLIPVCRELNTQSGYLDILYVNNRGLLTLVECKLWRNPEARREVVGQIIDYAKELTQWDHEKLQEAIKKSSNNSTSLYQLASESGEEIDESEFIDAVSQNLKRGRLLLLIVGDGIRKNVEDMADYLQRHIGLNFTLALVEQGVYELPTALGTGFLVQPRIIARTIEIERAVLRIKDDTIVAESPSGLPLEEFQWDEKSQAFFNKCSKIGISVTSSRAGSKILHWRNKDDVQFNFGTIFKNSTVKHNYIAWSTDEIGHIEIGEEYLESVAAILKNSSVIKQGKPWSWHVKVHNSLPTFDELLNVQDKWLQIIEKTIEHINNVSD